MRSYELLGLIILTSIFAGIVIPIPCIPPSCGPPNAEPYTTSQIILVYLLQPLTWVIILMWSVAGVIWWRRYKKVKSKDGETIEWQGFADAKPSESIQQHELPGLVVSVVFPHRPGIDLLNCPVKQYKDYDSTRKAARASELASWLATQKQNGLVLSGFFLVYTQFAAATFGLDFIEELPDTHVEPHYDTYRLFFGDDYIDFAQAIALGYYYFAINLGVLFASSKLIKQGKYD